MAKSIQVAGKRIGEYRYLHTSALHELGGEIVEAVYNAAKATGLQSETDFNVVKLRKSVSEITLLNYPTFFDEAFPVLEQSWKVD
ncbi:hypothetical protein, partial [Marinobacter sp. DY40_1A1]